MLNFLDYFQQKYLCELFSDVSIRFILSQSYFFFGLAIMITWTRWIGFIGRFPWGGSLSRIWPRSKSTILNLSPYCREENNTYTQHPIIRNFLEETVRERSVDGKWLLKIRVNYLEAAKNSHIKQCICKQKLFARQLACHFVENSKICWKIKRHGRQRRRKLRRRSRTQAQMH